MAEEGIVFFYNLAARISFSVLVDLKYCRCKYTKHHELCFCKLDSFQDRNKKELDFGGFWRFDTFLHGVALRIKKVISPQYKVSQI